MSTTQIKHEGASVPTSREQELAQIALRSSSLTEALAKLDSANLKAALAESSNRGASEFDAFEASFPAGSDGAEVAWTFDDDNESDLIDSLLLKLVLKLQLPSLFQVILKL